MQIKPVENQTAFNLQCVDLMLHQLYLVKTSLSQVVTMLLEGSTSWLVINEELIMVINEN